MSFALIVIVFCINPRMGVIVRVPEIFLFVLAIFDRHRNHDLITYESLIKWCKWVS